MPQKRHAAHTARQVDFLKDRMEKCCQALLINIRSRAQVVVATIRQLGNGGLTVSLYGKGSESVGKGVRHKLLT
jgi:hypothetical protein